MEIGVEQKNSISGKINSICKGPGVEGSSQILETALEVLLILLFRNEGIYKNAYLSYTQKYYTQTCLSSSPCFQP